MDLNAPSPSVIRTSYRGRVAVVTIDNEAKLGALTQGQYFELAQALREIATREDVVVTVLTGTGRYFSAGADVTMSRAPAPSPSGGSDGGAGGPPSSEAYAHYLRGFGANNLNLARAFYTHPKILIAALNGPAVGLSAAVVGLADLVYCAPHAFLLTPFGSLGLVAEGGASRSFVARMGPAKAAEALLMGRRIPADELVACGFANAVFDVAAGAGKEKDKRKWARGDDAKFLERVLREVDDRLGDHLNKDSLLGIKALMRRPETEVLESQNVAEVFAGIGRFMTGAPQEEFRKVASGEKRHKL